MRSTQVYLAITLTILFKSTISQIISEENATTVNRPRIPIFGGLLHPFYFYPLQPAKRHEKLSGLPPLPEDKYETEAPTTRPPFRLIPLPRITLPPLPSLDSYGINTIPELPPQHESKYAGQFAPDGSFIGKQKIRTAYLSPSHEIFKWAGDSELNNQQPHLIRARDVRPNDNEDNADYEDDSFYRDPEIEKKVAKFLERHPIKDGSSPAESKQLEQISTTTIMTIPENVSSTEFIQKTPPIDQKKTDIQEALLRPPPIDHSRMINTNQSMINQSIIPFYGIQGERDGQLVEVQASNKKMTTTNNSRREIVSGNAKQIRRISNDADSKIPIRRLTSKIGQQPDPSRLKNSNQRQSLDGTNQSYQRLASTHKPRRIHPRLNENEETRMSRMQLRKLHRLQAILGFIQEAPIAKAPLTIHANAERTFQVQQQEQQQGRFVGERVPRFIEPIKKQQLRPISIVEDLTQPLSIPQRLPMASQQQLVQIFPPQQINYQPLQISRDPRDATYLKEIEDYDLTLEYQKQQQQQLKTALNRPIEVDYDDLKTPQGLKYMGPGSRNFVPPQLQVRIPTTTLVPLTTQAFDPLRYNGNNNDNSFYFFNSDPLGLFGGNFGHPFVAGVRQTALNGQLTLQSSPAVVQAVPMIILSNEH